jgi:hypothetical protein
MQNNEGEPALQLERLVDGRRCVFVSEDIGFLLSTFNTEEEAGFEIIYWSAPNAWLLGSLGHSCDDEPIKLRRVCPQEAADMIEQILNHKGWSTKIAKEITQLWTKGVIPPDGSLARKARDFLVEDQECSSVDELKNRFGLANLRTLRHILAIAIEQKSAMLNINDRYLRHALNAISECFDNHRQELQVKVQQLSEARNNYSQALSAATPPLLADDEILVLEDCKPIDSLALRKCFASLYHLLEEIEEQYDEAKNNAAGADCTQDADADAEDGAESGTETEPDKKPPPDNQNRLLEFMFDVFFAQYIKHRQRLSDKNPNLKLVAMDAVKVTTLKRGVWGNNQIEFNLNVLESSDFNELNLVKLASPSINDWQNRRHLLSAVLFELGASKEQSTCIVHFFVGHKFTAANVRSDSEKWLKKNNISLDLRKAPPGRLAGDSRFDQILSDLKTAATK